MIDRQIESHIREDLVSTDLTYFLEEEEENLNQFVDSRTYETTGSNLKQSIETVFPEIDLLRQLDFSNIGACGWDVFIEGDIFNETLNSQYWPFDDKFHESVQKYLVYFNLPQAYQERDLNAFIQAERYLYMIYQLGTMATRHTEGFRKLISDLSILISGKIGENSINQMLQNMRKQIPNNEIVQQEDIFKQD